MSQTMGGTKSSCKREAYSNKVLQQEIEEDCKNFNLTPEATRKKKNKNQSQQKENNQKPEQKQREKNNNRTDE